MQLTLYKSQLSEQSHDVIGLLDCINPLLTPLLPYIVKIELSPDRQEYKAFLRFPKMSEAPFQYGTAKKHFEQFEINILGDHRQDPPVEIIVGNFRWY